MVGAKGALKAFFFGAGFLGAGLLRDAGAFLVDEVVAFLVKLGTICCGVFGAENELRITK